MEAALELQGVGACCLGGGEVERVAFQFADDLLARLRVGLGKDVVQVAHRVLGVNVLGQHARKHRDGNSQYEKCSKNGSHDSARQGRQGYPVYESRVQDKSNLAQRRRDAENCNYG